MIPQKTIKNGDQDKQPEQFEHSSSSGWNVTTSRMVIEFYKEIESCGIGIIKTMGKFNPEEIIHPFSCQAKAFEHVFIPHHLAAS